VAGTIGAAANDGNPHVGVAWNVRLMACKFLGTDGSGKTSDAIKCLEYAVSKGARILNCSWGGGPYQQSLDDAIVAAGARGVLFVAAAGNGSINNDADPQYPASYARDNLVAVAALDRADRLADFSNYGARSVHLGAPGVGVFSCTAGGDAEYKSFDGTSMAAPHVSGVAVLLAARYPQLGASQLKTALLESVVSIAALQNKTLTGGRLHAFRALNTQADGTLEVVSAPPSQTPLIAGTTVRLQLAVTDAQPVLNATATGTLSTGGALRFADDGQVPDETRGDGIYSAALVVPAGVASLTVDISITAPGKISRSLALTYPVQTPPPNDLFANRTVLSGLSATATGSSLGAGKELNEPAHAGNGGGRSVWWTWTAPGAGRVSLRTRGSDFDTLLAVYTGSGLSGLALVAANDDASTTDVSSGVPFDAVAGTAYQVAVDGYGGAAGNIVLTLALTQSTAPPGHDAWANATPLTGDTASAHSTNTGATKETGEPDHAGNRGGSSVWWTWTAPRDGQLVVHTIGSDFDTLLAVYTGDTLAALNPLASNDDIGRGEIDSRVTTSLRAGTKIWIAVDGYNGATGAIQLSLVLEAAPDLPGNDQFSRAAPLDGPIATVTGSTRHATKEAGEPDHAGNVGGRSIWYGWTAPRSGRLVVTTGGSDFDTLLAVYQGEAVGNLVEVASDDDWSSATTSQVACSVHAGVTYQIAVDGYLGDLAEPASGTARLSLALLEALSPPPNDPFVGSLSLAGDTLSTTGSNRGGTRESGEPNHAAQPGGSSVWWRWTAPRSGLVTVQTTGSTFDTVLAVYRGAQVAALTPVASNDDDPDGQLASSLAFTAQGGVTYQIAVDGYEGAWGDIRLSLNLGSETTALYATGFEAREGYRANQPLEGQQGWETSAGGGQGIVDGWFEGSGQQAYVGLLPTDDPEGVLLAWRPLNHVPSPNTQPIVRFSVQMAIVDSENGLYDDFGWAVYNRDLDELCALTFDNEALQVFYSVDGGTFIDTGLGFQNDTIYELNLALDFARNRWSAALDGQPLVTAAPLTRLGRALDLADIDAFWVARTPFFPGDNLMLFDDYRVTTDVRRPPLIIGQPQAVTAELEAQAEFSVVAVGPGPLRFQWRHDGVNLPGETHPRLSLGPVRPEHAGEYLALVTSEEGSTTSQPAVLTVVPAAALRLDLPGVLTPNQGLPLTVTGPRDRVCVVERSADLVEWTPIAALYLGGTPPTYVDRPAPQASRAFYRGRLLE
jgi:hypothetical protein